MFTRIINSLMTKLKSNITMCTRVLNRIIRFATEQKLLSLVVVILQFDYNIKVE